MCAVQKKDEVEKGEIGTLFFVVENFANTEVGRIKVESWRMKRANFTKGAEPNLIINWVEYSERYKYDTDVYVRVYQLFSICWSKTACIVYLRLNVIQ